MTTGIVDRFTASLESAGVECTRVEVAAFEPALVRAVEPSAVGVPLGIDGVSLDGIDVETALTPRLLEEAETGVTRVAGGIAEHGTFVIRSDRAGTEPVSLYPPRHVGVLRSSDLHEDVDGGFAWLDSESRTGRGTAILATGASATSDMGELVHGVHGPQTVHAIILTDR